MSQIHPETLLWNSFGILTVPKVTKEKISPSTCPWPGLSLMFPTGETFTVQKVSCCCCCCCFGPRGCVCAKGSTRLDRDAPDLLDQSLKKNLKSYRWFLWMLRSRAPVQVLTKSSPVANAVQRWPKCPLTNHCWGTFPPSSI